MPHTSLQARPAWDLAGPDLRVGIRAGVPPVVEIYGEIDIQSARRSGMSYSG